MDGRLVKENPLLLPMNRNKTVYDGFITVQDQDFRLRVLLPPDRQIKQAKVLCCWSLRNMLRGHEVIIKQRLLQSSDLGSFLLEMKTVLEVCVQNRPEPLSIPRPQSYSDLLSELETLGWDKLLFIDSDFRTLRLKADDAAGRGHVLTVKLKPKHPSEAPECTADVPLPLSFHWTPQWEPWTSVSAAASLSLLTRLTSLAET
ncbi:unnamed protein product [Knipowitschia caucasica]|uniref:Uncharacterized protein n=1 Tax=Knipowitschia caucasica TaxID=637954 RepID=A0AAV2JM46_KNICA